MRVSTATKASPEELLQAPLAGDKARFGQLVAPHVRELHVHCYRMLGSFHDAEDATQETLLRAWRHLHTFQGRGPLGARLYRIATTTCLKQLESRRRRRVAARPEDAEVPWLEPYPDRLLDDLPHDGPRPGGGRRAARVGGAGLRGGLAAAHRPPARRTRSAGRAWVERR